MNGARDMHPSWMTLLLCATLPTSAVAQSLYMPRNIKHAVANGTRTLDGQPGAAPETVERAVFHQLAVGMPQADPLVDLLPVFPKTRCQRHRPLRQSAQHGEFTFAIIDRTGLNCFFHFQPQ